MRRPFVLILILLSSYCWLKDFINFLFYIFHSSGPYKNCTGTIAGIAGVLVLLFVFWKQFYKNHDKSAPDRLLAFAGSKEWKILALVSLPVLILGLFRSIYPDQNFDTFHFELYLQESDFPDNKLNFGAGSIRAYYFPLAEKIFAVCRYIAGFRLGALFNTFILITLIASVYDFLNKFLSIYKPAFKYPPILPGLLALFIVTADNTLFNIGSYKPDVLGVPFLLELTYIVLFEETSRKKLVHFYFFMIVSLTIALKLTYLPYAGTLALIYYTRNFLKFSPSQRLLLPACILMIPGIYMIYNQLDTGNPIFPFFNKIFHSPLYPLSNFKDERFGPHRFYEIFIYPFVTLANPQRCNEFSLYSYRLLFGYLIAWGTFIFCGIRLLKGRPGPWRALFYLSGLALLFDYSCVVTTGYYRYGIIVELLYGIIICLGLFFWQKKWIILLIGLAISFQSYNTVNNIYIQNRNLSWNDYKELVHDKKNFLANFSLILHDYASNGISDPDKILPGIDCFISTDPFPYEGLSRLLNKNVPVYDIGFQGRTADSVSKFERNIVWPLTKNKTVMVAANIESLTNGIFRSLNTRGYMVEELHEVYPNFMRYGEPVFLLRVKYIDTALYTIKYTGQYLQNDSVTGIRNNFSFVSDNKIKTFIREAPYTFNWLFLPGQGDITINDKKYITTDRFRHNKIFTLESNSIKLIKNIDSPFFIMMEEIKKK